MNGKNKSLKCAGSGSQATERRVLNGKVNLAKCGTCNRVLKPMDDGGLREHSVRNPNTASTDRTLDTLWHAARPWRPPLTVVK